MHSKRTDVKPCAHCQTPEPWVIESSNLMIRSITTFHISCTKCTNRTGPFGDKELAVRHWNGAWDLTPRVKRLVTSARVIAFAGHLDPEELRELDRATEAFNDIFPAEEEL